MYADSSDAGTPCGCTGLRLTMGIRTGRWAQDTPRRRPFCSLRCSTTRRVFNSHIFLHLHPRRGRPVEEVDERREPSRVDVKVVEPQVAVGLAIAIDVREKAAGLR